jgi:hypothetical protein
LPWPKKLAPDAKHAGLLSGPCAKRLFYDTLIV